MKRKFFVLFLSAITVSAMTLGVAAEETETAAETAAEEETEAAEDAETNAAAEEETEAADASEAGAEDGELSDDLYSFQIKINGEIYSFPMSYEEFTEMGWSTDENTSEELAPNQYDLVTFTNEDGLSAFTKVANLGINNAALSSCIVAGIDIDSYDVEDAPDTTIELPGGIAFGTSTLEDIEAAYGTPSDTYEGDLYTSLTYQKDYYEEVELYVDAETGVLNEIDMENMVADEEANAAAAAEVTDDAIEEVTAYEAPTELGDDLLSYAVQYGGDLYQLPAPVVSFEENGWTIDEEDSDSVIAAHSFGWVYMSKDNQNYHTTVRNYSDSAATIRNCFVTSLEADDYSTKVDIVLQKGITMGMTAEELETALTGVDYELDEESESFHYYTIEDPDSSLDGIDIALSVEENKVTDIEVSREPDELSWAVVK